jgi:hypothetical protein
MSNPFAGMTKWEAVKMLGALIFIMPVVAIKDNVVDAYWKLKRCEVCTGHACMHYDSFSKKCTKKGENLK